MSTVDRPRLGAHVESLIEFATLVADASAALFTVRPEQLEGAVARALETVRTFFQADRCVLLAVSPDLEVVNIRLASYADGIPPVPTDLNLAPLFPWSRQTLLVERRPIRVSRLADLPPHAEAERESWRQMPIQSALTVPIETGGSISHLLVLNTVSAEREWPKVFENRLGVLGDMLVGALQRHDMFLGLRDARERADLVAEALRLSEARLAAGADLAGLGFYEVDFAARGIYLDDRFRALCGVPHECDEGLKALTFWMEHVHPDDLPAVLALRDELQDGRTDRLSTEYRYLHPAGAEQWIHHLAGVATRDANARALRTYGVLRDITARKQVEEELRDLSRRLIGAHEDERALLARELHDDFTQRLAVVAIDVGLAERDTSNRQHAEQLRTIREAIVRLSEDVHTLAYQLHPSVLDELGLPEALRTECERRGRRGRMDYVLDFDPAPAELAKDAALCLFRVAQEALNNVTRHSGARAATIALRRVDDGLLLAVSDSGKGFDRENRSKAQHLGLASMRERVRLVNGTLDIDSAPGRGTTVTAWVPLERKSP